MKEQAIQIAAAVSDPIEKLNRLREYLQSLALKSLSDSGAFKNISFVGGTALRFLHELPRFSEDLDFSLENDVSYLPQQWFDRLARDLRFYNFEADVEFSTKRTVHVAWVKIGGLMEEVGLTKHKNQKISIKIEIDTKPPSGAELQKTVINKYVLFAVQFHDLPSLMAGKIHALCTRSFAKGRDYYDLFWYVSKLPPMAPNLNLLQAAIDQTEGKGWPAASWRKVLLKRIEVLDWEKILSDVQPFLEVKEHLKLLNKPYFEAQLNRF